MPGRMDHQLRVVASQAASAWVARRVKVERMRITVSVAFIVALSAISSSAFAHPEPPSPSRLKHAFELSLSFEYMRALGSDHLGPSLQFAFKQNGRYDDDEHAWGVMPGVRARVMLGERTYRLSDTFSAAALPQLQAYFGVWRRFPYVEVRLAVLAGAVLPAAGAIGNVEPLLAVRLPADFNGFVMGSVGTFWASEASFVWSSGVGFGRAF